MLDSAIAVMHNKVPPHEEDSETVEALDPFLPGQGDSDVRGPLVGNKKDEFVGVGSPARGRPLGDFRKFRFNNSGEVLTVSVHVRVPGWHWGCLDPVQSIPQVFLVPRSQPSLGEPGLLWTSGVGNKGAIDSCRDGPMVSGRW